MVSAVFHSPSEIDAALPGSSPSPAQTAPAPPLKAAPVPAAAAPKPSVDWLGWALRTLSPLAGIALLIGIWAALQVLFAYIGPASGAVAWAAHVAGFLFGVLFALLVRAGIARRLRRLRGY